MVKCILHDVHITVSLSFNDSHDAPTKLSLEKNIAVDNCSKFFPLLLRFQE